jgi:hypothetical protein
MHREEAMYVHREMKPSTSWEKNFRRKVTLTVP